MANDDHVARSEHGDRDTPQMIAGPGDRWPRGQKLLVASAAAVVVVAGLRAASAFFVPIAFAGLLTLACVPLVRRLQRWGAPESAAIVAVLTLLVAIALLLPAAVAASVDQFTAALPGYRARLDPIVADLRAWLADLGLADLDLASQLDAEAVTRLFADGTRAFVVALSNVLIVLLVTIFALFEVRVLPARLGAAFGATTAARNFERAVDRIGRYVGVKALMSALTGVGVGVLDAVVGVDFALLWGFVAFVLNFVPNVGSILASLPAIALAGIEHGPGAAVGVAIGYVVINLSISNGLEPHVMGSRLGLSTLVVFVSLLFWFWVWGPVGMLLSVPLTVILKMGLEQSDEFRPIAVLLGRGDGNDR